MALTEALALELAADNILVNAIAPGPILAPPDTSDDETKAVERATPLGRWGGEGEIAKAVSENRAMLLLDIDFVQTDLGTMITLWCCGSESTCCGGLIPRDFHLGRA